MNVRNYIKWGLLEVDQMVARHEELVAEFKSRGWSSGFNHTTPLVLPDNALVKELYSQGRVHRRFSLLELLRRCTNCRARYDTIHGKWSATRLLVENDLAPAMRKYHDLMVDWTNTTLDDASMTFSDALVVEHESITHPKYSLPPKKLGKHSWEQ